VRFYNSTHPFTNYHSPTTNHHQHRAKDGQLIEHGTEVWKGPVTPYDGRIVAQSESLTISGLCIMPAHHLAAYVRRQTIIPSHLGVDVVWQSNLAAGNKSSQFKGTFMLFGSLDLESSIVSAPSFGGELRVGSEQTVRVSLCDAAGRNRVGGEDGDQFFLNFFAGPSLQPQVCARAMLLSSLLLEHIKMTRKTTQLRWG
jgi:hypothetical protein